MEAQQVIHSPIVSQVADCPVESSRQLLSISEPGVEIVYVKASEDKKGTIVRVLNLNELDITAEIKLPVIKFNSAWRCSTQEEKVNPLKVSDSKIKILLKPRELTSIRVE